MIITIHQPEHLPYFGFLDKVNKSDIFVVLDDVDFKKNNFQNRNQILTLSGSKWLTVAVEMKNIENKYIKYKKTKDEWKIKYRNQVVEAYRKYDYFDDGLKIIDNMLSIESNLLIDFNLVYIRNIFSLLNIDTEFVLSSSLNIKTTKTERLYDICKALDGTSYLAGQGAIDYIDDFFFKKDVKLLKHTFNHPKYKQLNSNEFIYCMSSLDFIMSVGIDKLKEMLDESKKSIL
jgi:hypothetical protein